MKQYRTSALCALLLAMGAWRVSAEEAVDKQRDGSQQSAKPSGKGARKSTAAAVSPQSEAAAVTIPAGAQETAPGTFSYTDPQGKKWTYRKTPFGIAKFEDKGSSPAADQATKKAAEQITAVEEGEFIRFERPSPFGTYRWKQKKTELGPLEQAAWNHAREKQSAAPAKERVKE